MNKSKISSGQGSRAHPKVSFKLTLHYNPPGINVMEKRSWLKWRKIAERRKAMAALESAIRSAVSDPSIGTTAQDLLKSSLTYFDAAALFGVTIPAKSNLKLNNNELENILKNGRKLK
jgi:hypothetical protein